MKELTKVVEAVLEQSEKARCSDGYLYYKVCSRANSDALQMPFGYVLLSMKELKIPQFESVRRCRQKIQASRPDLCAVDEVEGYRIINERKYRKYAREKL